MQHGIRQVNTTRRLAVVATAAALLFGACEAAESEVASTEIDGSADSSSADGFDTSEPPVDGESDSVGEGAAAIPAATDSTAPGDPDAAATPGSDVVPVPSAPDEAADESADTPSSATQPSDTQPSEPPSSDSPSSDATNGSAPAVHAAVAARQTIITSEEEVAGLTAVVEASRVEPPTAETVADWIASLTQLEQALDAEAIRALGDDPLIGQVAAPIDELDASVQRVLELLDPASGSPDFLGALAEAQAAAIRWEAAVPGIERAWEDAIVRWTAEWESAVDDWELAWEQAVGEWELAWEQAVAEWELAWEQAVVEWELAWEQAVVEWELAWEQAVVDWEAAWQQAAVDWQDAIDDWNNDPAGS